MLKINNIKIPFYVSEIKYSNFLDYAQIEVNKATDYRDVEVLTGVDFSQSFGNYSKLNIANRLRQKVNDYKPKRIKEFVHNNELYIIKDCNQITILEGILALNFAKEFTKKKYQIATGLYAMKLYLIATMTRKVINGQVEELPINLGEVHDFVEARVKELEDISFKNAIDFESFFFEFEDKLSNGYFKYSFKSIHPLNIKHIDKEGQERNNRYLSVYNSFSILEHLISNNLITNSIEGLKMPFFHCIMLYGMSANK